MKRRSNGAGTLIHTSTGLFIAKWCFQGKTYTRSTKCYDRKKALKKLDEFVRPYLEESEIAVLENIQAKIRTIQVTKDDSVKKSKVPLTELFDTYMNNVNVDPVSDATQSIYRDTVGLFVKWCLMTHPEIQTANNVTKSIAEEFLLSISKSVATTRYNCILKLLKRVFRITIHKEDVWDFKTKTSVSLHPRYALTEDQLKSILNYINTKKWVTKDLRLIFTLAIYTGLRLRDCCSIKWRHIDFTNNVIKLIPIKTHKNKREVVIPIHPEVKKVLKEFDEDEYEYVSRVNLHHYNSKHINWQVCKVFSELNLKTSGDFIGLHVLRHTFCTIMANKGVPMPVLQNMLGHSKSDITMMYYHPSIESAALAIQTLKSFAEL